MNKKARAYRHLVKPAVLAAGLLMAGAASAAAAVPAAGHTVTTAPGRYISMYEPGAQPGTGGGLRVLSLGGRTYVLPAGVTQEQFGNTGTRPSGTRYTLTVKGVNLAGQPDSGDRVSALDADATSLTEYQTGQFKNGMAKFSVPAGPFWLLGSFYSKPGGDRIVLHPEINVTGNTTVQLDAGSANSKIEFVTARPTTVDSEIFKLVFLTAAAP